jgi:hypothetical protein
VSSGRFVAVDENVRFDAQCSPEPNTGCFLWIGSRDKDGYGYFSSNKRTVKAHRFSYARRHGSVPAGMSVGQSCGAHECVNPDHLVAMSPEQVRTRTSEDESVRFDRFVSVKPDGCWLWTGSKDEDGYGYFKDRNQKTIKAHRFSYIRAHGVIGSGLFVCHSCDVPSCVNPEHLWTGTAIDNSADMVSKGRSARGDKIWTTHRPKLGAQHGNAKLTERDVMDTRRRCASGESQTAVSKDYGVRATNVNAIVLRRAWRHI